MSWLSHFTGWVGEKKNTILPIVTGLAGFAAGMIPGIGGALEKKLDKWGNKLSGATELLDKVSGGGDLVSPLSPIVSQVEVPQMPTLALPDQLGNATHAPRKPEPAEGSKTGLYVGLGVLAALLFGGGSSRR